MTVSELPAAPTRDRGDALPEMNPVVWPQPSPLDEWWHRIMHDERPAGSR